MAKKISDEIIGLKIVINGDEAQAKITQLTAKNQELTASLSEQEKILSDVKKETEGYKTSLASVSASIDNYNTKIQHNNTLAEQEIQILKNKRSAYAQGSSEYIRIQNQINKIQSKTESENRKIALSVSELEKKQALLNEEYKRSKDNIKTFQNTIEGLKTEISANKKEIDDLTKGMDNNALTMEQLRRKANDLRYALANMNPNSAEFSRTQQELGAVNGRMQELRTGSMGASSSIGNLADKFNRYSGMAAAALATFTGVAISIQQTIDLNNKLADAQSAVVKTTGMTKQEVKELTESFSEFDTRTSKMDLLKISEIGGRLGVPKEEIKNFTKEIDKAYVALGDSFSGGVEQVAEKLGKIKGLYKETKELDMATAINQVGSAMNDLGASGAASEGNIAEFAMRLGSMPEKLKPTVAEALALGAAFEESGIDAERSATAYSNFLKIASNNTERFAFVMGISQQEVKNLINTDPTDFFLKFSEGLKGMEATDIAQTLDYLKVNDQFVTSILSAASENADRFRKSIDQSNQSLQDATSLQQEFNEVNNNAAAIYDKVKKKFIGMLSSDAVVKTLEWLVSTFGKLIGAVEDTEGTITGFRNTLLFLVKILAVGATAFYSYNAAVYLNSEIFTTANAKLLGNTLAQKVHIAWTKLSTLAQGLWNSVVGLGATLVGRMAGALGMQTVATNLQTQAQARLNLVTSMNPWAAVLGLIAAVITAYLSFSDILGSTSEKIEETNDKMRSVGDIQKEMSAKGQSAVESFKGSVDLLIDTLNSEIATKEQRKKAYEALIKMHPEFMGTVDAEYRATQKLTEVYQDLVFAIDLKAKAQAKASALQKIYDENENLRVEYVKGEKARQQEQKERNENRAHNKAVDDETYQKLHNNRTSKNDFLDVGVVQSGNLKKKAISYKEHNKGVAIQNQINANNRLISDIRQADKKEVDYLIKQIQKATGKRKKQLEMQLAAVTGTGEFSHSSAETGSTYNIPTPGEKKTKTKKTKDEQAEAEKKKQKELSKALLDLEKKYAEDKIKMQFEAEENRIAMMDEGQEKEIAQLKLAHKKELAELDKQRHSKEEYAKLDEIIKNKTGEEKTKAENLKTAYQEDDIALAQRKQQKVEIHEKKILLIEQKYALKKWEERAKIQDEGLKALQKQEADILNRVDSKDKAKKELADLGYSEKELEKIQTFEQAKQKIQRHFQKENLKIQKKYLENLLSEYEKLDLSKLTKEQVEHLEKLRAKFNETTQALNGIVANEGENGENGEQKSTLSSFGGGGDILGMNREQWEELFTNWDNFDNILNKVGASFQAAQQLATTYFNYLKTNQEAELKRYEQAHERKKKTLQAQLDAGIISQQQYKHQMMAAENDFAMKKYKLELDAARREKAMKIAEAVSNTALAIMNIWSKKGGNPIVAAALTALVTGISAIQVATIAKQPLPEPPVVSGAEKGYYPVMRKQDGKLFSARRQQSTSGIYDEPTMLVGEQGKNFPELVVSGKALKRIDPKLKNDFMQEVYRAEGFEKGLYPAPTTSVNNDELMRRMISLMEKNNTFLENLERYGVRGVFEKSARTGKDITDMQKEYNRILDKNKH